MIKIKRKHYRVNLENPIKNRKNDIFGYDYEVKRIKNAIDADANAIGIVSDYGSGKSSLIELLIQKLCFLKYKIIKVNLWDNKLKITEPSNEPSVKDNVIPTKESIIRLHKTFLRQASSQTLKYNSAYINRRINANYGAAKISFPNYRGLFKWFIIYILLLTVVLYLLCKFGFDISTFNDITLEDKKQFVSFVVQKSPTILIGFVFFYIIFNKEVLFSFWNNSKSREITEEDTVQIYNELFGKKLKYIPRFRKVIIIIEDLDRIENPNLVEFYLNEFYRLYVEGNEKHKNGITMIFCLKDDKKDSIESKYIKIFDYISYINQINIDDKEEILRQLILNDRLLYDLAFDKKTKMIDISGFLWLIEGQKINLRTIKRRIEHFKSIYLMISFRGKSKSKKKEALDINLITCSFVAYLKTEYNSELDSLLSSYDENGSNYIDRLVNKKIIGELNDINNIELDDDSKNVKKLIVDMINKGYIDSQYKKYFYNFPKGTKIYTTTEKFVSDFITSNSEVNSKNISGVIKTFNEVDNDFIYDRIKYVNSLGKEIPNVALYESKSFNSAKKIDENNLKEKYRNILTISDSNNNGYSKTRVLNNSNIDKKELAEFISPLIDEIINEEDNESNNISEFRILLVDCFGKNISTFTDLYQQIQITKEEILHIKDLDSLLAVSEIINHDNEIDKLMSIQFHDIDNSKKNSYIIEFIDTLCYWESIYNIDIEKLTCEERYKIYSTISKRNISNNKKIELLLFLDYNSIEIADELITDENIDKNLLLEYLNKQTKCSKKCKEYFLNSNKIFEVSEVIFNSFEKSSEKYHAYYIYRNDMVLDTCEETMLADIFIRYDELTDWFKNNKEHEIIKKKKVYRKFDSNNVTEDKILVVASLKQTKDMVKSIMENIKIPEYIKCLYLKNIKQINDDASRYITSLINESTSILILNGIKDNRNIIYNSFNKTYKIKITKEINRIITKKET